MRGSLMLLFACALTIGCQPAPAPVTEAADLSSLLGDEGAAGFERAVEPREFRFPADHGPHPGFRNEWWYVTGNLASESGRRFGYQLTLFRIAMRPGVPAEGSSDWRAREVYMGHLAITDINELDFRYAERFGRAAAGLAGAAQEPVRIWLYDWRLRQRPAPGEQGTWLLTAAAEDMAIDLVLVPAKAPVLQGDAGLSQKSADPGNASYYYSIPRLATSGLLSVGGEEFAVSGDSWLDREWSSSALGSGQVGWDWFALQLDDGSELMYYQLRREDGSADPASAGSLVAADSSVTALSRDDVEIETIGHWDSPRGGRYPQGWSLRIPSEFIELRVRTPVADQELDTWVRYWEGAVQVSGTRGTERLSGRGYVELTGYAGNQTGNEQGETK